MEVSSTSVKPMLESVSSQQFPGPSSPRQNSSQPDATSARIPPTQHRCTTPPSFLTQLIFTSYLNCMPRLNPVPPSLTLLSLAASGSGNVVSVDHILRVGLVHLNGNGLYPTFCIPVGRMGGTSWMLDSVVFSYSAGR